MFTIRTAAVLLLGSLGGSLATVNIYGEELAVCDHNGGAAGSSKPDGKCDEKGGGIHSLCVSKLPGDFSTQTGQGPWTQDEKDKPWCVCIGAWSMYIAKGNSVSAHCNAIPDFVLGEQYIQGWSTWNGVELEDQVVDGVNALYTQCSTGISGSKLSTLKTNYCSIATKYTGSSKHFTGTTQYGSAGCAGASLASAKVSRKKTRQQKAL